MSRYRIPLAESTTLAVYRITTHSLETNRRQVRVYQHTVKVLCCVPVCTYCMKYCKFAFLFHKCVTARMVIQLTKATVEYISFNVRDFSLKKLSIYTVVSNYRDSSQISRPNTNEQREYYFLLESSSPEYCSLTGVQSSVTLNFGSAGSVRVNNNVMG